jgi:hypothetical protein
MRDVYKENLDADLLTFTHRVINKYEKGRQEHADDLDYLDVISEMRDELADMVAYLSILSTQIKKKL